MAQFNFSKRSWFGASLMLLGACMATPEDVQSEQPAEGVSIGRNQAALVSTCSATTPINALKELFLVDPSVVNAPEARTASFGAFGGVGTARGLAKFYAMLAEGGALEGRRWFTPHSLEWLTTTLTQGPDRVLLLETAFSAGFMRDPVAADGRKKRTNFGLSLTAFGHPGA